MRPNLTPSIRFFCVVAILVGAFAGVRASTAADAAPTSIILAVDGINVVRISEWLSAGPADAHIAGILGIRPSSAVLVIKRVAYTYHDQPVELRTSWVNTARHEYFTAF